MAYRLKSRRLCRKVRWPEKNNVICNLIRKCARVLKCYVWRPQGAPSPQGRSSPPGTPIVPQVCL